MSGVRSASRTAVVAGFWLSGGSTTGVQSAGLDCGKYCASSRLSISLRVISVAAGTGPAASAAAV